MDTYGVASLCKGYQGQIHLQSSSGVFFLPKWFPLFDRGYVFNHLDVCLGSGTISHAKRGRCSALSDILFIMFLEGSLLILFLIFFFV